MCSVLFLKAAKFPVLDVYQQRGPVHLLDSEGEDRVE